MAIESEADTERGCVVELIHGVTGFVIKDAACWFHYRDGTSFVAERLNTPIYAGESVTFVAEQPELGVELVILVINVHLESKPKKCQRGHDFHQAEPGRSLHQCTFGFKPAPSEPEGELASFRLERLSSNSAPRV